jgi:branched-chain amino acid transport system substrate-binding protein
LIALAVPAAALAAAASTATAMVDRAAAPATTAVSKACTAKNAMVSIEAPLTGPAGFLGEEQRKWAQMAIVNFNKKWHYHLSLKLRDTQLDPSVAHTVGLVDVGNANTYAIIGPSTSGAVLANGKLFSSHNLAFISPSATKIELTNGQFKSFFRVVANDAIQGAGDAAYLSKVLKAKHVYIVDGQEPYSIGLAGVVQSKLRARGVKVTRDSTDPSKETDFSPIVSKVGSDVNYVFLPWQEATAAQTFSQQLLQQGKKAVVFGTDGDFDPSHFHPSKGYISSFAPDVHGLKSAAPLISQFNRTYHTSFGTFGPPSYLATWIAATAIRTACTDRKISRGEVTRLVAKSRTKTPWGTTLRFNAKHDAVPSATYIFKITNGKYKYLTNFSG